jgi:hypothetical protein
MAYAIVFRRGEQSQIYEELRSREIQTTRYADDAILNALGLLDSVNYLLNNLNLNYFLSHKNPVYTQLTLEFLSSLIVSTHTETRSSIGTINFRMFNVEYELSFNDMAGLLHFPHGHGVACEVNNDEDWQNTFSLFWRGITARHTESYEGNTASSIHNPALRYFRHLLAHTIFGRANTSKVNSKEMFYMFVAIKKYKDQHCPVSLFTYALTSYCETRDNSFWWPSYNHSQSLRIRTPSSESSTYPTSLN